MKTIEKDNRSMIKGDVIAQGVALGTLYFLDAVNNLPLSNKDFLDENQIINEIEKFEGEVNAVIMDLNSSIEILKKDHLLNEAEIIKTHVYMLEDPEFLSKVKQKIKTRWMVAEIALEHVLREMINVLESSESMLFSERANDLKDVGLRLRKRLLKEDEHVLSQALNQIQDPILAVKDLLPSTIIEARSANVRGILVKQGSVFSHSAILAKSLGIPVLRIHNLYDLQIDNNSRVLLDGINGSLVITPDEDDVKDVVLLKDAREEFDDSSALPINLYVNVADTSQINSKNIKSVSGVGLYRTEFLFMKFNDDFPSEEVQCGIYSSFLKSTGDKPVTIRTLDIGGDKPLAYFSLGYQENPYLGLRAHRIYRFHPEVFITQLRAILRAGYRKKALRIMYPMVETIDDLFFIKSLVDKTVRSLDSDGMVYNKEFKQGVLIEVPSAVWDLKEILDNVDFVSLGTNDLFQYLFAVDRNNTNVSGSYSYEQPVALRVIKNVIDETNDAKKPVMICGEIASDSRFLPLLVGLGVKNLSVDTHAIAAVKRQVLKLDVSKCKILAELAIKAKRAEEIRLLLNEFHCLDKVVSSSPQRGNLEFIDPICNMAVDAKGNRWVVHEDGKHIYFCRKECKKKFLDMRKDSKIKGK